MSLNDFKVGPVVAVSDMARAQEFYEGKLGLSGREEMPGSDGGAYVYPCSDGTGLFVYVSPDHAGKSTATLVGWQVEDIEQVVDELTANGVTFEQYDDPPLKTDAKGIVAGDSVKTAFFRDPDGNTHSLNES